MDFKLVDESKAAVEPSSAGSPVSKSVLAMALTQLLVVAVFVLPLLLSYWRSSDQLSLVANLACLALVVVCLSAYCLARGAEDSLFDSLFPFILGAASLIGACYWNMVAMVGGHTQLADQWGVFRQWIGLTALLLVVLVVGIFGRQMLRINRTHVIRGLSVDALSGVSCIGVAGWIFTPTLASHSAHSFAGGVLGHTGRWVLLVVLVAAVLAVLLCVASWTWWLDLRRVSKSAVQPWLSMALVPVMFSGLLVAVALCVVHVLPV
ncbi:hypothetical protein KIM372_16100 [Bombiscardovia nodaiensis]|uniref:Uncharacterized protein n=1 Tax=Bombiscardovia nodaiensis TaxID=2932181 RepID=A0ABM8B9W7_9BIFI|nr:hypothetical protein KIM372_16100 [Bombiscardovia nodaiensis]